jgi:hypothetical protein
MRQPTEEIEAVIGTERKAKLIQLAADRVALQYGMTLADAVRYVEQTWPEPAYVVAIGQVWRRRAGLKRSAMQDLMGHAEQEAVTVTGIDRFERMVDVGGGRHINFDMFLPHEYDLVAWSDEFVPGVDDPQPPAASQPPPEEQETEGDDDEDDPRALPVLVQLQSELDQYMRLTAEEKKAKGGCLPRWLPMTGDGYRSIPGRCGTCYIVTLDVPAYLAMHLGAYRAGWPDFRDAYRSKDAMDYFNELAAEEYDVDVVHAAYLGKWLWDRLRGDVVREHGGNVDDYDVGFMWGTYKAWRVAEVCPLIDPACELPVDHPLLQCDNQETLFAP